MGKWLKLKYATIMLAILALMVVAMVAAFGWLAAGNYLLGGLALVCLYPLCYLTGRQLAPIFMALSAIRLLRQNGGHLAKSTVIGTLAGPGTKNQAKAALEVALAELQRTGIIDEQQGQLLLLE